MMHRLRISTPQRLLAAGLLAAILIAAGAQHAFAQGSALHPTFALLDETGTNVLDSGAPVSTMKTCGACHDAEFIATHSYHSAAGLDQFSNPGSRPDSLPWEMSPGSFGGWDPVTYRYLTPKGDPLFDLGTQDWLRLYGARHVGGGPAVFSQDGQPLTELAVVEGDPETHIRLPSTDLPVAWDWKASGVVEMDCFLCHLVQPDTEARAQELAAGRFAWANTATLAATGVVSKTEGGWAWNHAAFQPNGELAAEVMAIQDPAPENCGACHGAVHTTPDPLVPAQLASDAWQTQRTGQVFSGQRLKDTGLNLAGKPDLDRSWDVHAERNVQCVECHFSVNNPVYYQEPDESRPDHLEFDPRRLDFGAYLLQPDHNFAKGQVAQHLVAPEYQDSMRRCDSCHNTETTHDWLPYKDHHMAALSCESCHIPKLYAPALQQVDWTVITPDGQPNTLYRGAEGEPSDVRSLVTGFEPVLLSRQELDGGTSLMPYNLITTYYWVHGDPERPVRVEDLQKAYLDGEGYNDDILALFDANGDRQLDAAELRLDSDAKTTAIRDRLVELGLSNPRIRGDIQPYNINHDVAYGDQAVKECVTCHNEDSRISRPFTLTAFLPGGVTPQFVADTNVEPAGDMQMDGSVLRFVPATAAMGLYLPGHNRVDWVGTVGLLFLSLMLLGVVVHGGMRLYSAGRSAHASRHDGELHSVYMYTMYERAWHWLQAITILLLLATGIIIHRPDTLGGIDFGLAVPVHNILAAILVANAVFAAFYHFASGEIRQYLPEPHGFFRQAILQVDYYVRGIFRGDPHPFQKTPDHKLNPLQQVTYFAILNILLPLQILTGLVMWGAQSWPQITASLGGLPWLAPFHTLVAWAFAGFIVFHIYLTTTGHTPLANLKAMTVGWDSVESSDLPPSADRVQA